MQHYETMFIFNAEIDDGGITEGIKKIEQLVKKNGGEIVNINNWGRRKLAYPIKKQARGNYVLVQFQSPTPAIAAIEHQCLITESILRFMTLALNPDQVTPKTESAATASKEV